MGPTLSGSRQPDLMLTRGRAQQSWEAWLGVPPPGTAALTQKTSTSWSLLTMTLNPTTPASAGGRDAEKNVS